MKVNGLMESRVAEELISKQILKQSTVGNGRMEKEMAMES